MSDTAGRPDAIDTPARPSGPYWEDAGDDAAECERLDALLQDLTGGAMSDEVYWELAAEAKADRKKRKQDRKRQRTRAPAGVAPAEKAPSLNTSNLKKRIFNRHVSRANMIKALDALPASERAATIAGLPPGLKRKLGDYPKG